LNTPFALLNADSIEHAVSSLTEYHGDARILAGGTDLLVKIRNGDVLPRCVVNLGRLTELRRIEELSGGEVRIGALATLSQIAVHPLIRERYPALAEAAQTVGSVQIQNLGTLIGNLCNASPAADAVPPLLIYEVLLNIVGPKGRRRVPVEDFFVGPGVSILELGEIVESVDLPVLDSQTRSCYLKLGRTRGVDLAIVGAAVQVGIRGDARLAVASVAPTPRRLRTAERELSAELAHGKRGERAAQAIRDEIDPISDLRASAEYRSEMTVVLARRGIERLGAAISGSGDG
jgi:carbon-monoxide dehydrogenase medium subunit